MKRYHVIGISFLLGLVCGLAAPVHAQEVKYQCDQKAVVWTDNQDVAVNLDDGSIYSGKMVTADSGVSFYTVVGGIYHAGSETPDKITLWSERGHLMAEVTDGNHSMVYLECSK